MPQLLNFRMITCTYQHSWFIVQEIERETNGKELNEVPSFS
jgi:hypothetical protein